MYPQNEHDIMHIYLFLKKFIKLKCYFSISILCNDTLDGDLTIPNTFLNHFYTEKETVIRIFTEMFRGRVKKVHSIILNTIAGTVRKYNSEYPDNVFFSHFNFFNMRISCRDYSSGKIMNDIK